MDDIEEKHGFNYESFFDQQIQKKKMDHSYRVFKKVSRDATNFPAAREFSWGKKEITVRNILFNKNVCSFHSLCKTLLIETRKFI